MARAKRRAERLDLPTDARHPAGSATRKAVLGHNQGTIYGKIPIHGSDHRDLLPQQDDDGDDPGRALPRALVLATAQNNRGVSSSQPVQTPTPSTVNLVLKNAAGTASAPQTAVVAWFVVN